MRSGHHSLALITHQLQKVVFRETSMLTRGGGTVWHLFSNIYSCIDHSLPELASERRTIKASDGLSSSSALMSSDLCGYSLQECTHSSLRGKHKVRGGSWCGGVNSCVW